MLQARHQHLMEEIAKWIVLILTASLVALALATRSAGSAELKQPPGLLPIDVQQSAKPVSIDSTELMMAPTEDIVAKLWATLDRQRSGDMEASLEGWAAVALPCETDGWRHVAMAAAHVQLHDWDAVATALAEAEELAPDNALVHYYRALLYLERSSRAMQWDDAIGPVQTRLAAYNPQELTPNTKSTYELAAMNELEKTIQLARYVDPYQPLIWGRGVPDVDSSPRVGDLLVALGAADFEANAHNVLGDQYLVRGMLEQAEDHMDAAAALGVHIVYGYRDLGRAYEDELRHLDAARVYVKSMKQGSDYIVPTKRFLENLRKAIVSGR